MNADQSKESAHGNRFNDRGFTVADFEVLFKTHFPRLCVYCKFKFGFEGQVAEDLVNNGFTKLWEARQKLTGEEAARTYLYKTVSNLSLNLLKRQRVELRYLKHLLPSDLQEEANENFDSIDLKELRTAITAAVSALPEQMRKVFEMSRYEGMKYTEIAHELSITVKTVENQMGKALAKLRERLSAYLMLFVLVCLSLG